WVEAGEDVGGRLADDVDHRRAPLRLLLDALEQPRRRPPDHILGRARRPLAPDEDVGVARIDATGALGVGHACDCADERRVLDVREHDDVLALLEVDTDPQREPRVLLELFYALRPEGVGIHASTLPP